MFKRDFNSIDTYIPTAAEIQKERKERKENALRNWEKIIFHCQEARQNGFAVTMKSAIQKLDDLDTRFHNEKATDKEYLMFWEELIDDRLNEIKRAKENEKRQNIQARTNTRTHNSLQEYSKYYC